VTSLRSQRGFTLLELIVAAGIMALIAVFSWRGLDTLIREREAIAASQAAIDAYQRSFARLERDALLASDIELDESGTMRLLAGDASPDGSGATTVEYRLVNGTLTRAVAGVDAAPRVVLDGVATLTMEAWQPVQGGGGWVRAKAAAPPPPAPPPPGTPPGQATGAAPNAAAPVRNNGPFVPGVVPGAPPGGAGLGTRVVAAATGLRVSIDRPDGTRVTRAFMVGGS